MAKIPFIKMHGTGNDFVVIDNREAAWGIEADGAIRIADRHFGVGCDQLVIMERSKKADIFMRLFNADGSEIKACGNASRCIGWRIMDENGSDSATIETAAGVLTCHRAGDHRVTVDMGQPRWNWQDIPLSEPRNTEHLGIAEGTLMDPVAVNIGNPHMVFFVRDVDFIRLGESGPKLERNPLFPQRANVSAVQILDSNHLKMVVWERGTGLTMACGTAACAAVVAGVRRRVCERRATVSLPGGELEIHWQEDDQHVRMTGSVATVFEGQLVEDFRI